MLACGAEIGDELTPPTGGEGATIENEMGSDK